MGRYISYVNGCNCRINYNLNKETSQEEELTLILLNNAIMYIASEKLPETTDNSYYTSGIHINSFKGLNNQLLVLLEHTFENGIGILKFDDDIISISYPGFCGSINLTTITLPNSITLLDAYSLSGTGLTTIIIPENVTTIGAYAFLGCRSLVNVVIPNSVTIISGYAFDGCTNLESVTSYALVAPTLESRQVFGRIETTGTLYVPLGSTGYDTWMNNLPSGWTKIEQ